MLITKFDKIMNMPDQQQQIKTLNQEFGEFVKAKRMAIGMSQGKLAEKVYGNSERKSYISAIETGKKDISLTTAQFILEALNSWIEFTE